MKVGYAKVKEGSDAIRRALSDARSARNRATRQSREQDRDAGAAARRQRGRTAKEDREREIASRRRIRVQVPEHSRPRMGGSTPRRLFTRQAAILYRPFSSSGQHHRDGHRSLHFSFNARGFHSTAGRRWRGGEAGRASLYIVRDDALEGGEAGWCSNVAEDRAELLAFWRTVEAVERHDRANANVFVVEVISLDASLSEAGRRQVVTGLTDDLQARNLPFVIGMHKPDPSGDQRNLHVHVMYSLRPAKRHDAYDWSFAVSKVGDLNTPAGIKGRRSLAVDSMNDVLAAAGSDRRYTALSNKARGIAASPAPKLGKKAVWVERRLTAQSRHMDRLDQLTAGLRGLSASFALTDRFVAIQAAMREKLEQLNGTMEAIVSTGPLAEAETAKRLKAIRTMIAVRLTGYQTSDNALYEQRIEAVRIRREERLAELGMKKPPASGVGEKQAVTATNAAYEARDTAPPVVVDRAEPTDFAATTAAATPMEPVVVIRTTSLTDYHDMAPGRSSNLSIESEAEEKKADSAKERPAQNRDELQLALISRLFHEADWEHRDRLRKSKAREASRHTDAAPPTQQPVAGVETDVEAAAWDQILEAKLRNSGGLNR